MKMTNCRQVYPLKIIRPLNKYKLNYRSQLRQILDAMLQNDLILEKLVADNPKRAILREALNHCSNYACEYCTAKAVQFLEKISEQKKIDLKIKHFQCKIRDLQNAPGSTANMQKREEQIELIMDLINELKIKKDQIKKKITHSVWPQSTSQGAPRTIEDIRDIVDNLERNERSQLSADVVKGFVGRSLLLDHPNFPFIEGVPAEYMHLGCLGVVKRLLLNIFCELFFNIK